MVLTGILKRRWSGSPPPIGASWSSHIERDPHVAVVIGWDDEVTVQLEGTADILCGSDRVRGLAAYFQQYPDGRQRAESPDTGHIRVTPGWLRYSD